MKKLSKLKLKKNVSLLDEEDMKMIQGGYIGTGSGSPCYSSTSSCHSMCITTIDGWPRTGKCEVVFSSFCACVIG